MKQVYPVYVTVKVDILADSPEKAEYLAKSELLLKMPGLRGKAKDAFEYEVVSAEAEEVS